MYLGGACRGMVPVAGLPLFHVAGGGGRAGSGAGVGAAGAAAGQVRAGTFCRPLPAVSLRA